MCRLLGFIPHSGCFELSSRESDWLIAWCYRYGCGRQLRYGFFRPLSLLLNWNGSLLCSQWVCRSWHWQLWSPALVQNTL